MSFLELEKEKTKIHAGNVRYMESLQKATGDL